jgi:uncharacterized membrane protein
MAERDFYYGRPQRPQAHDRPYGPRGAGAYGPGSAGRRVRRYGAALASPWLVLGLGALAGAAAYYYFSEADEHAPRPRDSAPRRAARRQRGRYAIVGRTVTIAKPRAELYAFWRDPQNLAFMENIERVETLGDTRMRWTVAAPAGQSVTIETETVEAKQDELFAWRSVEGSDIEMHGRVTFRDAPGGRGTEVAAEIEYVPPGGRLGQLVAKLFQREPNVQVRHDLKRLKMLIETGEIATNRNRKDV